MILSLALSLLMTAPASPTVRVVATDPPVRLRLSDDEFSRGDHARVRVKLAEAGYLVVLRMDAQGRVRVLYPLGPEDSGTVRGGKEVEIRGRGDRDAFMVDEKEGTGTVLAARSDQPFDFSGFTQGSHWDYRALEGDSSSADGESALLDLVDRMTDGHYDYDVANYSVGIRRAPSYAGWYHPRYYDSWYRPFYGSIFSSYYPYYPNYPLYGPRVGFGFGFGFGDRHPRAYRRK